MANLILDAVINGNTEETKLSHHAPTAVTVSEQEHQYQGHGTGWLHHKT